MYVNLLLKQRQSKSRPWLVVLILLFGLTSSFGQIFYDDAIVGDDEACPGLSNQYHIKYDLPIGTSFSWYIDEMVNDAGGTIVGDPLLQTNIDVTWEGDASGYTRLIVFGAFIPVPTMEMFNIYIQDTVLIHVDKDLDRIDLVCRGFLNLDFGPDCERYLDINEVIGTGTIKCEGDFEFTLTVDNHEIPNPIPAFYLNREIKVTVRHTESGLSCMSTVLLVDGTAPDLICMNDTILCSDPRAYDPTDPTLGAPEVIAGCNESYRLEVNEYEWFNVESDPFITGYIKRTWRVTDAKGNTNQCMDTIFLKRIIFDDIVCPRDTMLECSDTATLLDPFLTGTPTYDGQSIYSQDPYCKIYVTYKDTETPGCGSGKEITRVWRIVSFEDDGNKMEKECVQTISIVDTTGPDMIFDPELYVSEKHDDIPGLNSDKYYPTYYKNDVKENCQAEGDFPIPMLIEDCSEMPNADIKIHWGDRRVNGFNLNDANPNVHYSELLAGKHMIVYSSMDECWNVGKDTIVLVLRDKTPPKIVLDLQAIVTITGNEPIIWAKASDFDEGTKDNCGMQLLLARRVDWKTACGYTEPNSVVKEYYDEQYDYYSNYWGECIASVAEYGWSEQFPICCEDVCVEGGIWVEFMAIDAFCNVSKLVTRVQVEDKSVPKVVSKLPDLTMNSYSYHQLYKTEIDNGNYSVFGDYVFDQADVTKTAFTKYDCSAHNMTPFIEKTDSITNGLVLKNCNLIIEEELVENISSCGEGWLERTFSFWNPCMDATKHGPILVLTQKINIVPDCLLRSDDFMWPAADTTIYSCTKVEVALDSPTLVYDNLWRTIGIAHKDVELFPQTKTPGLCHKILRTWTVGDWCADDPYYLPKYEQYIYMKNLIGPSISNGGVDDICINSDCTVPFSKTLMVSDDCTPVDELNIRWTLSKWVGENKSIIAAGVTTDISNIDLGVGRYSLSVTIEDHCNNELKEEYTFGVSFCSAVSFTVPAQISKNITGTTGILNLDDINYSISLPCAQATYDVRMQYKGQGKVDLNGVALPPAAGDHSLNYSCNQLGSNVVELWVVDAGGIGVKREFTFNVLDPYGYCPNAVEKISGTVKSATGEAISNVQVSLMAADSEVKANMTNMEGDYDLGIFPNAVQSYKIKPYKEGAHSNGISTLDVLTIYRMAKGQLMPNSPYQKIAADINEDGNISVFDVIFLQNLLLNRTQTLPGENWKFFNSEMKQISDIDPTKEYKSMLHFIGVKKGDVNNSAKLRSSSRSNSSSQEIRLGQPIIDGSFVKVPVSLDRVQDLQSMQISLKNLNPRSIIAIESGSVTFEDGDYKLTDQQLDIAWIQREYQHQNENSQLPHFYLVYDSQNRAEVDLEKLEIGEYFSPEIYADQFLKENVHLTIDGSSVEKPIVQVGEFYPNPFADYTNIDMESSLFVNRVEIYDVSGRMIWVDKVNQAISNYNISHTQLQNAGFYTVRFVTENQIVNKKLYFIK